MVAFADTGFVASLYLKETTSAQARAAIQAASVALPLTPLAMLELRNAFNRAVQRQRITMAERDALWQDVETDIANGFLVPTPVASDELHKKSAAVERPPHAHARHAEPGFVARRGGIGFGSGSVFQL